MSIISHRNSPFGRGITPYISMPPLVPKGQYALPAGTMKQSMPPFEPRWATPGLAAAQTPLLPLRSVFEVPVPTGDLLTQFNALGKIIVGMALRIEQDYPLMNKTAAKFLRDALKRTYGLDIDPDKTYLHTFANGHTNHTSFNGWAHQEPPTATMTLTQAVLANRQLHGDYPGSLDGYLYGIYSDGPTAESFDDKNEVKLLPSQLMALILKEDFYSSYKKQLALFWRGHRADYRALVKAQFVAHATQGLEQGSLPASLFSMVMKGLDLTSITAPVPLAKLDKENTQRHGVTVRTFDINGYPASDILHFKEKGHPGVVLYMAGEASPLRHFSSDDALKEWVCANDPKDAQRQNLRNHFSLYDRQDGAGFFGRNGVDHSLQHLVAGDWDRKYINKDHDRIASTVVKDVFTYLTERIEHRDFQDADTNITSSSEVNKDIWRERLELLTLATSLTAPFAAPIDLLLAMGSLAELTLGIDNAVTGDTTAIRGTGLKTAIVGALGFTGTGLLQTEQSAGVTVLKEFTRATAPATANAATVELESAAHLAIKPPVELINLDTWLGAPVIVDVKNAVKSENGVLTVNTGKANEATYIVSKGKTYAVKVEGADVVLQTPSYTPIELDTLTEEWRVVEPLSSHVPPTSSVYVLIETMKAMGYRATEGEINRLIALRVFADVRQGYQRGFKSTNKVYIGVPKAQTHLEREKAAYDALSNSRRRPPVPIAKPPTQIRPIDPSDTENLTIEAANCGELSNISAKLVMENGGYAEQWYVDGGDHAFTVVGMPPLGPTVSFQGWKDVWIIDAWANIVCPAEQYQEKLLEKMQLWHSKGKHIDDGARIFDATDPGWLGPLANNLKRALKKPTVGNPRPWEHYPIN